MIVTYTSGFFYKKPRIIRNGSFGHFVCNFEREGFLVIIIGIIYNALVYGDLFVFSV